MTVLADDRLDIVMFDVPPPYEEVRVIDAYRDSGPDVLRWHARGDTTD